VAEHKSKKAAKSKRGRPQGRDAQATRAMIVQAARVLFGIHGYSATTVKMVAQQAGVSFQAVYYHFSGIEDIYDAVVADVMGRLEHPVSVVFAQPTLQLQIRTYAYAMHTLDYSDRTVMAFMIREYLDARRGRERGKGPLVDGTEQFFVALVRAAIKRGELAPEADLGCRRRRADVDHVGRRAVRRLHRGLRGDGTRHRDGGRRHRQRAPVR
jgi:AcrR family transcriptional regulator